MQSQKSCVLDAVPPWGDFQPVRRSRGRPKVMSDEDQADKILAHAEALFLEKGFAGTTMNDIAARCRMSKRTLYRLFPAKTEMFAAIVRRHREQMLDLPGPHDDMPMHEALRKVFRVDLSEEASRYRIFLLRMVLTEAERTPEIAQIIHDEAGDGARVDLALFLDARVATGDLKLADTDRAAQMLVDMMYGALSQKREGVLGWSNSEERRCHIEASIDLFLNGAMVR
jgi:TetR/AcrR family transcriptional repressor of mexJK operon